LIHVWFNRQAFFLFQVTYQISVIDLNDKPLNNI
jgi:hypothetical protein